ncbi:MAG: RusA family crossover junction endodeoxyribonuclease [Candidatus Rokubacteria bacterium]|nr:RusA family crossover junction endodeoxyribonuclease [Candidatus Rokubacteria bacterium]
MKKSLSDWIFHDRFEVVGRPASFSTAPDAAWRLAVATALARNPFPNPDTARFKVVVDFRTTSTRPDENWDIDNLAKPTLDAMSLIFGPRKWKGSVQPQDDRVDELIARKREARPDEATGASIEVWFRKDPR